MPPTPMPHAKAEADETAKANALALQAVRALLAEERRALPARGADWRLLLALYEAELDGRALTPPQAAEAAAIPADTVAAAADHLVSQDFLVRAPNGALRLTQEACAHMAIWVYALNPIAGFNPYRAAAGAPPPEPPPKPPGSQW